MASHNLTGSIGEDLAASWFEEKGFSVLHRNWRHGRFEVDIIATKNNMLHFIEVKCRRSKKFGHPEENVSPKKIKNLIDASAEFLYLHPEWQRIQFDILAINLYENEPTEYFYIEDVYL